MKTLVIGLLALFSLSAFAQSSRDIESTWSGDVFGMGDIGDNQETIAKMIENVEKDTNKKLKEINELQNEVLQLVKNKDNKALAEKLDHLLKKNEALHTENKKLITKLAEANGAIQEARKAAGALVGAANGKHAACMEQLGIEQQKVADFEKDQTQIYSYISTEDKLSKREYRELISKIEALTTQE
jgi:mevalonate kinase